MFNSAVIKMKQLDFQMSDSVPYHVTDSVPAAQAIKQELTELWE